MEEKLHFQYNISCGYAKHSSGKNDPLLSWNFSNLITWRGDMGQNCIFKDNIWLWVLNTFVLKHPL